MALGDTDISVCNKALLLLGSDTITSFSDGTPAAQVCSLLYKDVKLSTMGMYRWSFTVAKTQLNRDTNTPQNEWSYQYLMPNDMLIGVPEAVRTSSAAGSQLFKDWEIGQATGKYAVLMTNALEIHIDYQRELTEANLPSYFIQLLGYQVAWHIAEAITDQTTKAEYWRNVALGTATENMRGGYFRQATAIDSGGQTPSVVGDYLLTDVR
jgi:hypothetical protein